MSNAQLLRKITRPTLPPTILHREALVRRLNEIVAGPSPGSAEDGTAKVALLHAPAGYGKTTLLADFAQQTTIPCCWYTLDRSDTDVITFLETLLASIRARFPHFGTTLDSLLAGARAGGSHQPTEQRFQTAIEALTEAFATEIPERFVLVLCNYQEVNASQQINHLVNLLLRLPFSGVLLIESRAIPDLDFAPLLAHREMLVMSSDFFRLSAQEIRDLAHIQDVATLSDEEAVQLATVFDGWMAGILLGTRLGDVRFLPSKAGGSTQEAAGMPVDRHFLFAYVVNEVFTHHPAVYAFLKDASILQEMTPSLCDALLDITDSSEHLYYLEQHALFVTQSGPGSQLTYICHPVLRELLCDELRRQSPQHFIQLHRRAAELLGAAQDYERAIAHAQAGDCDLAGRLIIEASEQLFTQGRIETLTRWIDALPAPIIKRSARLLLIRARTHSKLSEHAQALPLLTLAQEAMTSGSGEIDADTVLTVQAEIALERANVLCHKGPYHEAQELCQQVLDALPADEVALRAEAHRHLGTCACLLGNVGTAIMHLQQALHLCRHHTAGYQVADVYSTLAIAYNLQGNFALASHHLARAMSFREHMHDVRGKMYDLVRLGVMKQYQGAFEEAEATLTEALTLANTLHYRSGQAYALVNLGGVYQDQGRDDRSLACTEEGLVLARQVEDTYLVNFALCILALAYLHMGDSVTAMLLVSQTDVSTSGEAVGHERVARELTYGTIFYYQCRYEEALASLTGIEAALSVSLRKEQIKAQLHMAACHLALGQTGEVVRRLNEVTQVMTTYGGYEQLVLIELHRLSALEQAIKTLPEAAQLRPLLHMEMAAQEAQAPAPSSRPAVEDSMLAGALVTVQHPQLRILALGEPTVLLDEEPVTRWRMARAMELFFYLLNCGHPMHKEQIITALWPEVDEQIDHTFHSTIYYLRKTLGESCVVSRKGTYTLDLASRYGNLISYDVAAFESYHHKARQALAQQDAITARTTLLAMVDLYRGDYVQSFYNDWCAFRRDELSTAYLDARHHLAQLSWQGEQFDESTTHWQHILAVDSCQEEAHYGLMRCYMRQGKRGLALRQYQRCRETLNQEFGVQPGTAIQNLYQRLAASPSQ